MSGDLEIRHDMYGYYVLTAQEADWEDEGNNSAGFDGRDHSATIEDAARAWCDENNTEPHDREVYEHWIVSDWFARRLAEKGEKVDTDFAGLTVWARTCSGQSISLDGVVQDIAIEANSA